MSAVRDELLDEAAVRAKLAELHDGWSVVDARLHRELEFAGFAPAFACMTQVALAAEQLDHHPDWSNSWNKVVIDITNHASGGLTDRCFRLAAAVDAASSASRS